MKTTFALLSLILLCCGCRTYKLFSTLAPQEPPFLMAYRTNANSMLMSATNYTNTVSLTAAQRNDYINDGITVIDSQFTDFLQNMGVQISGLDTLGDMAILGTQLAAAGVPAAGAKTVFSLIGSGLTGTRIAAEKNYFAQKSAAAVYAKMLAYRYELRIRMEAKKTNSIDLYRLSDAVRDLREYHAAGSLIMTTIRITSEAGASLKESESKLNGTSTNSVTPRK